jgi:hypothetical protein
MLKGAVRPVRFLGLVCAVSCLLAVSSAHAQFAGVYVDPDGVLRMKVTADPSGMLTQERINAARIALDPKVAVQSPLRKISLNRLEKAIKDRLAAGESPSDEMLSLAGLTRIQYVFYFPDTQDIVIAGKAEGWLTDPAGRVRGLSSGQPVILLEDLVAMLRLFGPTQDASPVIGCSIDPTQDGLAKMQNFLRSVGGSATPADTNFIAEGLRTNLGLQTITVMGVPADTHVAEVMVEADYRMKLIGIGLEPAPVKMKSYVELADAGQVSRNAMQRWYFVPNYEAVRTSDDGLAMELVGAGVRLVGEDEMVSTDGSRGQAATANKASHMFVTAFTKLYSKIADNSPVYAQLRNVIDLAIAAAYIQDQDFYEQAGWTMEVFSDESQFPIATRPTPKQVETAVNAIWRGHTLMTPVGGGVEIDARAALSGDSMTVETDGTIDAARKSVKLELAAGQWWWD